MRTIRQHLTYANVIATVALFLALGGAAVAATQLPRNSVGTGQLKPEAVTAGKIAKRTRRQLKGERGPQGPAGPQGKTGKTGAKGATGEKGATGARGTAGENGTGPAFEVVTGGVKPIGAGGSPILAENLSGGAYLISANVVIESSAETIVACALNGGGEAVGFVEPGVPTTLSLSQTRTLGSAGNATLTCAASGGATARFANVIATLVKSQSRVAG